MGVPPVGCRVESGQVGAGRQGPPGDQVELAAQAEAGGRVEQGRHERQPGGDGADDGCAEQDSPRRRRRRRAGPRTGRTAAAPPARAREPGPSRGATSTRKSTPYGAYRRPAKAPTAKTTACDGDAATPLPSSRARASTALVTQAANRGPRTSTRTRRCTFSWRERPSDGGQGASGRSGPASEGRTEAAADAAQVDCAARGQQGAHGGEGNRSPTARPDRRGRPRGRSARRAAEHRCCGRAGRPSRSR